MFSGLCSLKVKPTAFNILIPFMFKTNKTSSKYIYYAVKLYFSGLSLRKTSEHFCLHLSKETRFLFGTGFNDISQDISKEKEEGIIRTYYR